jgi:O-antigen ligase
MSSARVLGERWVFYFAAAAAVAPLISTAAFNILLAAAFVAVILSGKPLRLPPLKLPLALFVIGTVISVILSPDPAAGLPQLKKFYVFLMLVVAYCGFRGIDDVRRIVLMWAAVAAASGLWSFLQFWQKREQALALGHNFYTDYVGSRATGFMSHWMTFGAEQMTVLLVVSGLLFFGVIRVRPSLFWALAAIIGLSVIVGFVRSIWFATAVGLLYLVAVRRPKLLALVPVLLLMGWFAAPQAVQQRVVSIYKPHGSVDSNEHRSVTRKAGWEMVKAHPLTGIGPQMVVRNFEKYVPEDVPRPLPTGYYGHLHNVYLQYAAERGVPTLIALLWLIGKVLMDFVRALRSAQPDNRIGRAVLHGAIAVLIAIVIEGLFEVNLGDSEVLAMFLSVIGWGYIARESRGADV